MRKDEKRAILEYFHGNFRPFFSHYITNPPKEDKRPVLCPFHDDHSPSLSLNYKTGQFYCHACKAKGDVLTFYALIHNLDVKRDFPTILKGISSDFNIPCNNSKKKRIVKVYNYTDEKDKLLFQVVRFKPKGFSQRRPDEKGEWIYSLDGAERVLYCLPELIKGPDPVFITEGEKDADNLVSLGFTATTNSGGAGKWRGEYNPYFQDRDVIILPHNDPPGKDHSQKVANSLVDKAKSVKVLELPDLPQKGDLSDWLDNGGDKEALLELVQQTPQWGAVEPKTTRTEPNLQEVKEVVTADFGSDVWFVTDACLSVVATLLLKDVVNPTGLNLIGPPASSKTTILSFFYNIPGIVYKTDNFTPKAFVSHATNVKQKDLPKVDLLPKIRHRVMIVPELAPVFGKRKEDLIENVSTLTRVFDGQGLTTDSGSKGQRGYQGDYLFAWLGATTPLDFRVWNLMGKLGSRWLFLNMPQSEKGNRETTSILGDILGETSYGEKVKRCNEAVREFLLDLWDKYEGVRGVIWNREAEDSDLIFWLVRVAQLVATARSVVSVWREDKDQYNYSVPVVETPKRLAAILFNLARGHAIVHNRRRLNEDDLRLIIEIALSSMPSDRSQVLELFYERPDGSEIKTSEVEEALGVSKPTARAIMKTLSLLKVVNLEEVIPGDPSGHRIRLADGFRWFTEKQFRSLRDSGNLKRK